jgi:uncharacterized protein (DUF1697 family)
VTEWIAFLRGVNLGKRQVKSADLKAAFDDMGYAGARTLIASGNVLFADNGRPVTREGIEAALEKRFGFDIGTVLRTREELQALVALDPFGGRVEDEGTKLYCTFLAEPVGRTLPMPCRIEGDFEVVRLTDREVLSIGHRMPDGRYGLGREAVSRHFGRKYLWTDRNWNTVLKAAQ